MFRTFCCSNGGSDANVFRYLGKPLTVWREGEEQDDACSPKDCTAAGRRPNTGSSSIATCSQSGCSSNCGNMFGPRPAQAATQQALSMHRARSCVVSPAVTCQADFSDGVPSVAMQTRLAVKT